MTALDQQRAADDPRRDQDQRDEEGQGQADRRDRDDRQASEAAESERDESPAERADRNYSELVQELRVAQTGVQILFGFLLAVVFTGVFPLEHDGFVTVLVLALLTSFGAAISFMCPVLFHRLQFREGRKEGIVWVSHWMVMLGMALLVTSMDLVIWLVLAHVFSPGWATLGALLIPLIVGLFWYVLPNWILNQQERGTLGHK